MCQWIPHYKSAIKEHEGGGRNMEAFVTLNKRERLIMFMFCYLKLSNVEDGQDKDWE